MGVLDKVSLIREDYRDLLSSKEEAVQNEKSPTLDEELYQGATKRYGEETIVNLSVALHFTLNEDDHVHRHQVIEDALGILDHLDTLGMEVRHKR